MIVIIKNQKLRNFKFWSGAADNAAELSADQLDQIESILEDLYPQGMKDDEINDFFWFDFETVEEWLGITKDDEDEDEPEDIDKATNNDLQDRKNNCLFNRKR